MNPEQDRPRLSPLPSPEEKARCLQYATPQQLEQETRRRYADSAYSYDHQVPFISLAAIAADLTRRAEFFAGEHEKSQEPGQKTAARQLAAAAENCRQAHQALGLE